MGRKDCFFLGLLFLAVSVSADGGHGPDDEMKEKIKDHLSHWGYTGAHGVDHWAEDYADCGGQRQSPINIDVQSTQQDESLSNIDLIVPDPGTGSIDVINNGHSVSFLVKENIYISGGGMIDEYKVAGFHFHWGSDDSKGSEHTIDQHAFPLEMHIVNFDVQKYGTLADAVKVTDALAVLGVMFEISEDDNPALTPLIEKLASTPVPNPDTPVPMSTIDLNTLLPSNTRDYYRYLGSLTTPGCFESVIWTLFKTPQKISQSQIEEFRKLTDSEAQLIVNNYRPTQPLSGRTVSRSFPILEQKPASGQSLPGSGANSIFTTLPLLLTIVLALLQL